MNGQSERVDGMKVVILAGGYGTRLSEETGIIPKPMIEIGGRPLLWHLMKTFRHHGMREFIVALGYKGQVIKRYFLQYPQLESNLRIDLASGRIERDHAVQEDWTVDLVDTGSDSMTGGRLRRLGPIYEELGRVEDAIIAYARLAAWWAEADPDRQPIVRDARARLVALQSRERSGP